MANTKMKRSPKNEFKERARIIEAIREKADWDSITDIYGATIPFDNRQLQGILDSMNGRKPNGMTRLKKN